MVAATAVALTSGLVSETNDFLNTVENHKVKV